MHLQLICLPLDFVSGEWSNWSVWDPLNHPSFQRTGLVLQLKGPGAGVPDVTLAALSWLFLTDLSTNPFHPPSKGRPVYVSLQIRSCLSRVSACAAAPRFTCVSTRHGLRSTALLTTFSLEAKTLGPSSPHVFMSQLQRVCCIHPGLYAQAVRFDPSTNVFFIKEERPLTAQHLMDTFRLHFFIRPACRVPRRVPSTVLRPRAPETAGRGSFHARRTPSTGPGARCSLSNAGMKGCCSSNSWRAFFAAKENMSDSPASSPPRAQS